ncbi:carbohydrate-binding protein [Streptomyces sp. NPDC059452]|uniref:carbohydrate-binding protein n=1 Tax=Streptomyces sp. NPDC059452 TaxID=3346835 RepID=UPI0036A4F2AC
MENTTLRRRVLATATATVAVGALAIAGLNGVASAGAPAASTPAVSADSLSPGLLAAMERDLGLDAEAAKTRIAGEYRAAAIAAGLEKSLGTSFAGARVSGDTADLTVSTTDASEAALIEKAGATAEVVGHSLDRLEAVKDALDKAALSKAPKNVPVWYVDVEANRVIVNAASTSAAEVFVKAAGVSDKLITVARSTEQPRALADIRGGDAYYMNPSGRCSVGFSVTRGTQNGFVTAGHCGRVGTTTNGVNQQAQGSFQGSTFPGRDYAWVATNANWVPKPLVNGYGRGDVTVTGSTPSVVGASVCRSGSTTGWHCGTIQQLNTSVTYPEGTISGVTRTSVCAEPGDSGGSYISGSQAQGVTSGGSGNCRTGGTTYFQPLLPALQAYGLTLVTSGGGTPTTPPTTPPPTDQPGGTWAAGTSYAVGATVTYGGATYRCLQAHTAQAGWTPAAVPALWQRI